MYFIIRMSNYYKIAINNLIFWFIIKKYFHKIWIKNSWDVIVILSLYKQNEE